MLSNGNFHIAGAGDCARRARPRAGAVRDACASQRCLKLFSPALSELPLQLTRHGPRTPASRRSQKTLTALYDNDSPSGESRVPRFPAGVGTVEDHAPMAVQRRREDRRDASSRCATGGDRAARRRAGRRPARARAARRWAPARGARMHAVRARVAMLDDDRPLGPDIETIAAGSRPASCRSADCARDDLAPAQLGPGAGGARRTHRHLAHGAGDRVRAVARHRHLGGAQRARLPRRSAVSGFLYTIPTLAFLALLIPIVGLGKTNAIICMVAFSLMIMIRNVATGIREVPAEVIDAARGMGMRARRDPVESRAAAGAAGHRGGTAHRDGHRHQRHRRRRLRQRGWPGHADLQRHQQRLRAEDLGRRADRLRACGRRRSRPRVGSSAGCGGGPRS